jgi:hypothetical protein
MSIASPSGAEVSFKIVITHYNQVLRVLGLLPHAPTSDSPTATSPSGALLAGGGDDSGDDGVGGGGGGGGGRGGGGGGSGAVAPASVWPREELALSTSGGVGLFGVFAALDATAPSVRVGGDGGPGRTVPARLVVSEVPPAIRLILPNLSVEEFRKLKRDSAFLSRTLRTCEGCFLVYAQVWGCGC